MNFKVSSGELLKQLQIAGGAISSNPIMPILEDFLFSVSNGALTISTSDLESSITTTIPLTEASGDGKIAVPARILTETLKALPDQPVTFEIDEDNFSIQLTSNYGKYRLAGENPAEFPDLPVAKHEDTVTLSSEILTKAITKTLFAVSTDELRPAMTGVYFQIDPTQLICVATDAHKLVKNTFRDISTETEANFILPRKSLQLLKNALQSSEKVVLSTDNTHVFFEFGHMTAACRLIDARYPDYRAVIPVDNPNLLTLQKGDFQNSLRRIAIYANKSTNQVVLSISDGSLTISAQDLDFSNEAKEQLPCSYTGEPMVIAFNAKFLLEMLTVIDADEIKLELSTPNKAGILFPADAPPEEESLMLVMPVMLSN
jgi:DNA polymerase-3 subunit beta